MYSDSINNLIVALKKLPSVGQRTAERFVFHWLKSGKLEVNQLREALGEMLQNTKSCEICWNFDDVSPCHICSNPKTDQTIVCVISDPQDIPALEKTGEYHGSYHVLRGLIESSEELDGLQKTKIKDFWSRLNKKIIKEVILALNPDLAGETTMLYLEREIKKNYSGIKVTRLARGLPMGSDLQYADEITLGSALKNRIIR